LQYDTFLCFDKIYLNYALAASTKKKKRKPIKTEYIVAIIGAVATVIAGILGSPLIEKWLEPESTQTATPTFAIASPSPLTIESETTTSTVVPSLTLTEPYTPSTAPLPTEITDDFGVEMVLIPAGGFTMGSDIRNDNEKPPHQVYLDAYYIDKYEVTNALYKACVDAEVCDPQSVVTGSASRSNYFGTPEFDDYPVLYINWNEANTFCEWRDAGLPTEAHWEKAARGTSRFIYPWGEEVDQSFANYHNSIGDTIAVGSYENGKSPYGLYDMAGNVKEWVADYYAPYSDEVSNNPIQLTPQFFQFDWGNRSDTITYKILRGGGFFSQNDSITVTRRTRLLASGGTWDVGFRCARALSSLPVTPTSDPRTATVEALLTQAAETQTSAADQLNINSTPTQVTTLPD